MKIKIAFINIVDIDKNSAGQYSFCTLSDHKRAQRMQTWKHDIWIKEVFRFNH